MGECRAFRVRGRHIGVDLFKGTGSRSVKNLPGFIVPEGNVAADGVHQLTHILREQAEHFLGVILLRDRTRDFIEQRLLVQRVFQRLLSLHLVGDIALNRRVTRDFSCLILDGEDDRRLVVERSVFALVDERARPGFATGNHLPKPFVKLRSLFAAAQDARVLPDCLLHGVAGCGFEIRVGVYDIPFKVGDDDGLLRLLNYRCQLLIFPFCGLLFGDVTQGEHPAVHPPGVIVQVRRSQQVPSLSGSR